jgi:hypothetical protein
MSVQSNLPHVYVTVPRTGKEPIALEMFPAGDVMTKPFVPDMAAIDELRSLRSTVVPVGSPFLKKTSSIAAAIALRVSVVAVDRPEIVKGTTF